MNESLSGKLRKFLLTLVVEEVSISGHTDYNCYGNLAVQLSEANWKVLGSHRIPDGCHVCCLLCVIEIRSRLSLSPRQPFGTWSVRHLSHVFHCLALLCLFPAPPQVPRVILAPAPDSPSTWLSSHPMQVPASLPALVGLQFLFWPAEGNSIKGTPPL